MRHTEAHRLPISTHYSTVAFAPQVNGRIANSYWQMSFCVVLLVSRPHDGVNMSSFCVSSVTHGTLVIWTFLQGKAQSENSWADYGDVSPDVVPNPVVFVTLVCFDERFTYPRWSFFFSSSWMRGQLDYLFSLLRKKVHLPTTDSTERWELDLTSDEPES